MHTAPVERLDVREEVKSALHRFLEEARREAGTGIGPVVLYGSQARGDAGPDSDVDLFIHWIGPEREARRRLRPVATRIFLDTGILLSLHFVSPAHLEELQRLNTGFFRSIQQEGIVVEA